MLWVTEVLLGIKGYGINTLGVFKYIILYIGFGIMVLQSANTAIFSFSEGD